MTEACVAIFLAICAIAFESRMEKREADRAFEESVKIEQAEWAERAGIHANQN